MVTWNISIDTNELVWIVYKGIEPVYTINKCIRGRDEEHANKNAIKFLHNLVFITSDGNLENSHTMHQFRELAIGYIERGWSFTAGNKIRMTFTTIKYSGDGEMH